MALPTLYFLRHGQTEWNAARRLQGQRDSPLTETGVAHAKSQRRILAQIGAAAMPVYCSPLGRARQTAEIAVPETALILDDRLSEIHAGDWQGLTHDQIKARWPDRYAEHSHGLELFCNAPNGEGFAKLETRIQSFLSGLNQPSVIFAHGLSGQVLRGTVCGLDRAEMGALSNDQGVVYRLECGREIVMR
jgi:probable phosphoglycerate mutase